MVKEKNRFVTVDQVAVAFKMSERQVQRLVIEYKMPRISRGEYDPQAMGDNVKVTIDGTDTDSKPTDNEWTGKFDGKDYPVTEDPSSPTGASQFTASALCSPGQCVRVRSMMKR